VDNVLAVMTLRKLAPFVEIEGLEIAALFDDNLGVTHVQQHEGALDRADVDRLPEPVEHQHVLV
jgi:hypothetical protein